MMPAKMDQADAAAPTPSLFTISSQPRMKAARPNCWAHQERHLMRWYGERHRDVQFVCNCARNEQIPLVLLSLSRLLPDSCTFGLSYTLLCCVLSVCVRRSRG